MRSGEALGSGGLSSSEIGPAEVDLTRRRLPRHLRRKSVGDVIFDACNYLILAAFSVTILYPYWYVLLLSLADAENASSLGLRLWNSGWSLHSYEFALSKYGNVVRAYGNSMFRTVVGTSLGLVFTLLAAYPLSKKNLPGRSVVTIYILITMFFSGGIVPEFLLVRNLGLFNTRWALILPRLAVGFYIIIARNFLMTIDDAYEESAFMDGANYFQVLVRIIMPLAKPLLATIALWLAVLHWNEWFQAMIYTRDESKIVLQLLVRRMIQDLFFIDEAVRQFQTAREATLPSQSVRAAITVLTIGPIVLVYPFLQRHFIKGVFAGSLKG